MAIADDLDRATDSQWEWVAEQTRTYLDSGGTEGHDPEWFKNLQANPSVGVQAGTHRLTAQARAATPTERGPLWTQMAQIFPLYDEYAQKTDREIPIVLLRPQA